MAAGDVAVSINNPDGINCNNFNGTTDYVEIAHDAAQLGAALTLGFTISAWVYPRTTGETNGRILDKSASNVGGSGFDYEIGGTPGSSIRALFRINNGTGIGGSNLSVTLNAWNHVAVTVGANSLVTHYVNGFAVGTPAISTQLISAITTTNAMRIGNRSAATDRTFDGGIHDVKMWSRPLSVDEIKAEAASQNPATGNSNGLIHWFKLGGDLVDYGSVGVSATASGSYRCDAIAFHDVIKAARISSGDLWIMRSDGPQRQQVILTNIAAA